MNYGGDAAEQVVRMSLEGMNIALRLSGSATKNLVAILAAVLKEEEKTRGKARLTNMLKSGKELTIFSIPADDLKTFTKEAKKYGALYYVVKDKHARDGIGTIDVLTRAEDAPKINRIVERFRLAAVNEGQIVSEAGKNGRDRAPLIKQSADQLIDEVLDANPSGSRTE